MNILITGGAGFIGTNSARFFAADKRNKVYIVDNFSRQGVEQNAKFLVSNFQNIKIIKTDVNNITSYKKYLVEAGAIIHLAGQTAVTSSIKKPVQDFKDNLSGGFTILEAVRKYNSQTVLLFSSTNKVYGNLANHKLKKIKSSRMYSDVCHPQGFSEDENLDFITPYGCSKGATDLYFLDYARIYGLNTVVFRQSCIYGEFQIGVEDQGWVAHFTKQFIQKKPLKIFGDGYQVRDLLYVGDLVNLYDLAIKNISKVKGEAFNIGGGKKNSYSLIQVIELIQASTGDKIKIDFAPERLGDQKYFASANKKIKDYLGWQPRVDFNEGLEKLITWQYNNLTI